MKPNTPKKIRVLIADDHQVVREGLSAILNAKEDIEVIAEAQDGVEAVEKAKEFKPDVILMDISMPRMNGVEATRRIKLEQPQIGIVVLTMYEEEEYIFELVKAGATGYMLKNSDSSQIIKAIRSTYQGESMLQPSVATKILSEFSHLSQRPAPKPTRTDQELTDREVQVIKLIADGKTNKEIANTLTISEKTVKNHVRNIFQKLEVDDRTQAAIFAIQRGLIQLGPSKPVK
ncbi:MAG: response regulator [Nitrospiria bacterium]